MPDSKFIKQQWDSFWNMVKTPTMGRIQKQEMEKTFFAGAFCTFNGLVGMLNSDEEQEATEEDLQFMSNLNDELNEYVDRQASFVKKVDPEHLN